MKLGRRFIGADINLGAIQITTKRLLNIAKDLQSNQQKSLDDSENKPATYYTGLEVYNVNHYDVFRNPIQAKDLLVQALELNPLPKQTSVFDGEKDGWMVKIMPVNRIATRADLNEIITGLDWKAFEKNQALTPSKSVQRIQLVCMGHEPQLADALKQEALPYKIDVEVVDILRNKQQLQFKRDSEAEIVIENNQVVVKSFYPMNLLEKLSLEKTNVTDWRELVESIMIDFNYDGAVLEPTVVDIPERNELVIGRYSVPESSGTIHIKITDLLSESFEMDISHG
jgi:site-specific DNA-methyltransferase (adenine-specific)/adenine-specific DNA-methyltransferase